MSVTIETEAKNSIRLSEVEKVTAKQERSVKSHYPSQNISANVRIYVAATNSPFTTRQLAKAVYPKNTKITRYETKTVSTILLSLVKSGKVTRTHINTADAKNSGQLLYHPVK